jgi:RNA polymerase sigma factor (sigma-70 family)
MTTSPSREALAQFAAADFLRGMGAGWIRIHEDDVRQEARIAAWRAEQAYDPARGAYGPFIKQSVTRKLINYLRDTQRRVQLTLPLDAPCNEEGDRWEEVLPGEAVPLDVELIRRTETETAWRALWTLPVPHRRAVRAVYGRGEGLADAGRRLGLSPQHVGRISRAGLVTLREAVQRGVAARPARKCLSEQCQRVRTTLGYCNRCYQRRRTNEEASETPPQLRQISRGRQLSAKQHATLAAVRQAEWVTTTALLAALGLQYRTLMYRLERLEAWGYIASLRQQHASGGMERIWRVL